MSVKETVVANKTKIGPAEALKLIENVDRIVASKGKRIDILDLQNEKPKEEDVLALLIGPTGNLRAPTAIVGSTLLVGFNEEAYNGILVDEDYYEEEEEE